MIQWPAGRRRTPANQRKNGNFKKAGSSIRYDDAVRRVSDELERIRASAPRISTGYATRLDGRPTLNQGRPSDPGAVVYCTMKEKPYAFACDAYTTTEQNIAAIAAHIEATRAIERYGVATAEEMFTSFLAIGSGERHWRDVFALLPGEEIDRDKLDLIFRRLARERHPDQPGGNHSAMSELNAAYDRAKRELGGAP